MSLEPLIALLAIIATCQVIDLTRKLFIDITRGIKAVTFKKHWLSQSTRQDRGEYKPAALIQRKQNT